MVQTGQANRSALSEATDDVAEIAAVPCPVDRAVLISQLARRFCWLPPLYAAMRRAALLEARAAGHRVVYLAERLSVSSARISELTREGVDRVDP